MFNFLSFIPSAIEQSIPLLLNKFAPLFQAEYLNFANGLLFHRRECRISQV